MENLIEVLLSLSIIVLTILAIVVYIDTGPNAGFYGLFLIALVVMVYTWRRVSRGPQQGQPMPARRPRARKSSKKA